MNTVTVSIVLESNYAVDQITQWVGEALGNQDVRDASMRVNVRSITVEADEVP